MNRLLLPLAFGLFLTSSLNALVVIDDGGDHIIDSLVTEHYQIEDSTGGETTSLEIVDGADMRGQISALEHSFVKISGGQKTSGNLNLHNDSTGEIDGGLITSVQTFQSSTLTITNGTLNQLTARDDSSVSILNVSFQNLGQYAGVYLTKNTEVSIYGSDFVLTDVADTPIDSSWDKFELSGVFGNGTAFTTSVFYLKSDPGKLKLASVTDSDGDGMDDEWEQQIVDADAGDAIETIAEVLPGDDFDGDDYTNLEEFDLGLIPTIQDAPSADSDGDGMDDAWEQQIIDADASDKIKTIADVLPDANFDGDDYTNFDEFRLGLSPAVQDPPRVVDLDPWVEYQGSFPTTNPLFPPDTIINISLEYNRDAVYVPTPGDSDGEFGDWIFKGAFRNIQIQAGTLGNFNVSAGDATVRWKWNPFASNLPSHIEFTETSGTVYTGPSVGGHPFRGFSLRASAIGTIFRGDRLLPRFSKFGQSNLDMRWFSGPKWSDGSEAPLDPSVGSGLFDFSFVSNTSGRPNLTAVSFDVHETSAESGDEITVSYRIKNTGTVSVGGFGVNFYLSGSPTFDLDKEYLRTETHGLPEPPGLLAPGETGPLYTMTVGLPAEIESAGPVAEPKKFYIGMVIDPYDFEDELDETDNANMGMGIDYDKISITGPPIIKPVRFDAHHINHDGEGFSPSDPIDIDWEVLNVGYGTAPPFEIEFLFDPPVAIPLEDGFLGSFPIDMLESGASQSGKFTGDLPPDGSIAYNPFGNKIYKVAPNIDPFPLRWVGAGEDEEGFDFISMIGIPAHLRALNLEINQFEEPVFAPGDAMPVLYHFDNDSLVLVEDPFSIGLIISRDAEINLAEDLIYAEVSIPGGIRRQTILSDTVSPALPPHDSPIWREGTHSYYLAIVVDLHNEINDNTRDDNITPSVFVQRFTVTKQSTVGGLPQVGGGVTGGTGSALSPFQISDGVGVSGLDAGAGSEVFFELPIPEGIALSEIQLNHTGGSGTISVLRNGLPTSESFDDRVEFNPEDGTTTISISISISNPEEGSIFIRIDALSAITAGALLVQTTAAPDNEPPSLRGVAPFQKEEDVPLNSVITFVFSEPMDLGIDPREAIDWAGLPAPTSFDYRWSSDKRILFCNYSDGFPQDATISWSLNPGGSVAKLKDVAGNELLSDGNQQVFHTSASSNIGLPDVERVEFFKTETFVQFNDTPFAIDFEIGLSVEFSGISTVTSLDFNVPESGKMSGVGDYRGGFRRLEMNDSFFDSDELNAEYPDGRYRVDLQTVHEGEVNVTLDTGTGDFPAAPMILNFSATQAWDHTQPVTLHWSPMPGGTFDDVIYFHIGGFADWFEAPIALNGLATSITIPANTLPPGQALDAELIFVRPGTNDTTQYPGARVISGLASATRFFIETLGEPLKPEVVVQHDGTMATVRVTGELGQVYDVYRSDNLAEWHYLDTLWLYDDRSGFLGSSSFKDDSPSASKQQFYRLE